MARYAKLLNVDRMLRRRVRVPLAAMPLAWAGNAVLRLAARRHRGVPGVDVAVMAGRFDAEVSALDAPGSAGAIRGRRFAEDLNWRYRDDPLHQYVVLTARRAGALAAFAILLQQGEDAYLVDLAGQLGRDTALALLDAAADLLRGMNVQTFHAVVSESSPLVAVLTAGGFRYRAPGASVVAYAPEGSEVRTALTTAAWDLTESDVRA
jgi:hypothetical protein